MSDHHYDHNHAHDHHHGHAGRHHHVVGSIQTAFFLNFSFTILEAIGGVLTNSTAILANAVHDFGDSIALGQAWYFRRFASLLPAIASTTSP